MFYRVTKWTPTGPTRKATTYARDVDGVLRAVRFALETQGLASVEIKTVSEAEYVRGTRDD